MEEIYQDYKGKSIGVVGLLLDTSSPDRRAGLSKDVKLEAAGILSEADVTYPQLTLPETLVQTEIGQTNRYPTSYFVDSSGKVVGNSILGGGTKSDWVKRIDRHLTALEKRKTDTK